MDYLLKASAILIIFYVCYQLFLQRETFFQANRWFLLSGLIVASCIPFVIIPVYIEYTPIDTSSFVVTANDSAIPATIQEEPFDYLQLLFGIYFAGIIFFFGKLIIEFLSLRNVFKHSELKSAGDLKIMETNDPIAPFSFFNRIVYNPNQFKNQELAHVINHEKVHIKELHSVDTIIAQLSCLLFWFNPIIWLYKKALQQNLEFIADQKAQYISVCEKSYQTVLLKASVKNHQIAFTNNFYTSLIKKRIVMLHKSKSNKLNQIKFAIVLPLLALFMLSFNTKDIYVEIPIVEPLETFNTIQQNDGVEIVINKDTTDEQLKMFKEKLKHKGITFAYSGIKRNKKGELTSIKTDFKNEQHSSSYNISGDDGIKPFRFKSNKETFSVGTIDSGQNTFVYRTKDGKTKTQSTGSNNVFVFESDEDEDHEGDDHSTKIKVKTSHKIDSLYFEKAKGKAQWISRDGSKTNIVGSENGNTNIFISESDDPLFVVDGKLVKKSLFENVDSDDIKSINVLKGKTALEAYGEKGENGVIIMTRKGSENVFINSDTDKNITVDYEFIETDGEQPLFILDGKVITKQEMNLAPDKIMNIEVLKDKKAFEVYGEKGKNGVIIIKSKNNNEPLFIEVVEQEENPWKIRTEVQSFSYKDDNGAITAEFIISKYSTDAFIAEQKAALKKIGVDAKINKIRRNNAGEITSIKISLDDNQGQKSSASWKEKEQAIPDIVLGKSGDKLFVRAIGN